MIKNTSPILDALRKATINEAGAVAFLEQQEKRRAAIVPVPTEVEGIRFRADGLRSDKMGLRAARISCQGDCCATRASLRGPH